MALRFCDSFSHLVTAGIATKWTINTSCTISAGTGRFGDNSLRGANWNNNVTKILDAQTTWIVGFALRATIWGSGVDLVRLIDGATTHATLRVNASKQLTVTRNGTLLGTGTTVLSTSTYYYIEFKCNISDTVGAPVIRINGVAETMTWVTGTASTQDTRNAGNATADTITIGGSTGLSTTFDVCDLYVCDTAGSTNNDFLGDVRVEAIFPSGNGTTSNLVGSDGNSTDNYLLVDETAPDTADYVESSTVTDKDTYAFGNLTSTSGSVYGVQVLPYAAKTDAGVRSIVSVARLSGTEVDGATKTLSTTPTYYPDIRETKPGGGAWSISDVNSAEFGVKVTA